MADCYISEHVSAASAIGTANPSVLPQPAIQVQKITIGAHSEKTLSSTTRAIMIVADGACHFAIGAAPVADANSMLLPANVPMIFGVAPGAVISVAT